MILSRKQARIVLARGEQYRCSTTARNQTDHRRTLQSVTEFLRTSAASHNFDNRGVRWMREWIAQAGGHCHGGVEESLFYQMEYETYC